MNWTVFFTVIFGFVGVVGWVGFCAWVSSHIENKELGVLVFVGLMVVVPIAVLAGFTY